MQHKQYSDKEDDDNDECFLPLNKSYWTMHSLQANNNYTYPLKYYNVHILVFITSCSWYELHMDILKSAAE
jgi:hypothetical protein